MVKEVRINNQTFKIINKKLKVKRLVVKNNSLKIAWHKACMSNGCSLTNLAKAWETLK